MNKEITVYDPSSDVFYKPTDAQKVEIAHNEADSENRLMLLVNREVYEAILKYASKIGPDFTCSRKLHYDELTRELY